MIMMGESIRQIWVKIHYYLASLSDFLQYTQISNSCLHLRRIISAFVFATQTVQFLYLLKHFHHLSIFCDYGPVFVGHGRNPNCRFCHAQAHLFIYFLLRSNKQAAKQSIQCTTVSGRFLNMIFLQVLSCMTRH